MSEKKDPVREYLREIGSRGGSVKTKKGFATLTDEERKAIAAKAADGRKKAAAKKSTKP